MKKHGRIANWFAALMIGALFLALQSGISISVTWIFGFTNVRESVMTYAIATIVLYAIVFHHLITWELNKQEKERETEKIAREETTLH